MQTLLFAVLFFNSNIIFKTFEVLYTIQWTLQNVDMKDSKNVIAKKS